MTKDKIKHLTKCELHLADLFVKNQNSTKHFKVSIKPKEECTHIWQGKTSAYIPQPTDKEIVAIRDAPRPTDLKELKAYSGFLNYYGSFLQNLSTVFHPLHYLLEKGEQWS